MRSRNKKRRRRRTRRRRQRGGNPADEFPATPAESFVEGADIDEWETEPDDKKVAEQINVQSGGSFSGKELELGKGKLVEVLSGGRRKRRRQRGGHGVHPHPQKGELGKGKPPAMWIPNEKNPQTPPMPPGEKNITKKGGRRRTRKRQRGGKGNSGPQGDYGTLDNILSGSGGHGALGSLMGGSRQRGGEKYGSEKGARPDELGKVHVPMKGWR